MGAIIVLAIAIVVLVLILALLTGAINIVLVAMGLSAVKWWVVVIMLAIVKAVKWLLE